MSTISSESRVQVPAVGRARKIGFYVAGGLFVALFVALYGFVIGILEYPITGWFKPEVLTIHQLHDTVGVFLIYMVLVGMLVQVRRPFRQVGGMQQTAVLFLLVLVLMAITGNFEPPLLIFLVLLGITAVLHPARRRLLTVRGVDPYLLGLTAIAAVPLLDYGIDHVMLQINAAASEPHAAIGHYVVMGAYAIGLVLLGILASLRPRGWRTPTYSAAALAVMLGVASLVMPGQASGVGSLWGALAIVWGIAFVAVAEWRGRTATE